MFLIIEHLIFVLKFVVDIVIEDKPLRAPAQLRSPLVNIFAHHKVHS
jgi:hypothetical protein